MRIAILHLSDFHVKENDRLSKEKIERFLESLNVLGKVDEHIIVFSGDLAFSGKESEYKKSRQVIGSIISGIKAKNGNRNIDLFMVPGNHDLSLTDESRKGEYIQQAYDQNQIESLLTEEFMLLNNYYTHSHANFRKLHDKILSTRVFTCNNDFKIQFNLINTSLFSTLEHDDKELHYFPKEKITLLKKLDDANICITVMHHGYEWFNWNYKTDLEKAIINNSEFLLMGHDHKEKTKKLSIDNSMDTWISCAGEMNFSIIDYEDSYNSILIDTDLNTFSGYIFNWAISGKMYAHKLLADNKPLQSRKGQLISLPSYIKEIKEDQYTTSDDFTRYFVFPQLISDQKDKLAKNTKIASHEDFIKFIETYKRILIFGPSNSGKTTLLKNTYCSIQPGLVPLLFSVDSTTNVKSHNFVKRLFEDHYGEDALLFEKYQQLDKNRKMLIVDDWDRLRNQHIQEQLCEIMSNNFGYIILSANSSQQSIIGSVEDEINPENSIQEMQIKPFFTEKRNQLVRNICTVNSSYNDEDIIRINKLIDSLVQNNYNLFSLNPAFIIRYTDYFIKDSTYNYTKGEAVFSKVFEYGIQTAIMKYSKKSDVDEIMTALEELAGHIFKSYKDILKIEDFRNVIGKYNEDYCVNISADTVLEVGIKSKLLKKSDDLSLYFSNKNHLAYFIAKYLYRLWQGADMDYSGIEYALRNICFGINSDIILFISYLSSNTRTVMAITDHADSLLSSWEELSFESNNISFLDRHSQNKISAPTANDSKRAKVEKEQFEESNYNVDTIEAKGLFDYDVQDIDKLQFRLVRAITYTEMLCKSLPAFNNMLKREQKDGLIDSIYSYPHKIAYAILEPIDKNIDRICNGLLELAKRTGETKKGNHPYTRNDIIEMINAHARAIILSMYDHFTELCTNSKTVSLLCEKETIGLAQQLEKLMIWMNSGNLDKFIREAEKMMKILKDDQNKNMIRLMVRKHLICNPDLPHNKRQQITDKFFGSAANKERKELLLPRNQ
jgi:predicted phosphodiesterase